MKKLVLLTLFIFSQFTWGQTVIKKNGFEASGDTWIPLTFSTPPCTNGSDQWDYDNSLSSITPSEGSQFWGIRDLNGNCGGSGYETITHPNTDISNYTSVSISFDYYSKGYDGPDYLGYEIWEDGSKVVDNINLDKNSNDWITVIYNVNVGVTNVSLILKAKQNGGNDYAGFDNVLLKGTATGPIATITATPTSLNGFTYIEDFGPSAEQSFNVAGSNLTNDIIITPPTNWEIALTSGGPYQTSAITLTQNGGTVNTTPIYTRMIAGLTIANSPFSGTITCSSTGVATVNVTVNGTVTRPENPTNFTAGCIGQNSIDLSWSPPANGDFDGYLLVVREGASPHAVNSLDPNTALGENLDYSIAATYGSTNPNSRILYKGTGTNITVSGLTTNLNYTFRIFTYKAGSSYKYSSGTSTSKTIKLADVSNAATTPGNTQLDVSWSNPNAACFDEIMIVINDAAGITFNPSGNGSAYSANSTYTSNNQVVYIGNGTITTVTGLTNGTTYYFEIFVRNGTEWSNGIEISGTPNSATVLDKGDLAILAVNTQYGSNGRDELSFVSFVDIAPNTKIYLTDNGYQRRYANEWGGSEGVISIKRTGSTLAKGTIITIRTTGNVTTANQFTVYTCGAIDTNWEKDALSGSGIGGFNLNSDDDVWIMQGGTWTNSSSHHSTYTGKVLYGWTESGWNTGTGNSNTGTTKWSAIYPDSKCFTSIAPVGDGKVKFNDPNDPDFSTTTNDKLDWIALISNTNNWDTYTSNNSYNNSGYDYYGSNTCPAMTIADRTHFNGKWTGDDDNNWFNCNNWDNLKVPNENTNVTITSTANNQATVDATAVDSNLYNHIAKANDLTIEDGIWLEVLNTNDKLDIYGNLNINLGAALDMDGSSSSDDGTISIYGNWNNLATESEFYEGQGTVKFIGNTAQTVSCGAETEKFYNLAITNPNGVTFTSNNIYAAGNLSLHNSPDIIISSGHYILAGKNLHTNTSITLEHGASLVQTDNSGANSGSGNTNYTIKKNTNQTVFSDVSYFASPTVGTTIDDMVANTTYHYSFSPSAQNWNYGLTGATVMEAGRGYIIRNPNLGNYTVTFNGTIHNGTINYPVLINGTGATDDDDWNLLGNPYPSAIDADKFFITNSATIVGAVYYWNHDTPLNASQSDYINGGYTVYNAIGAVGGIGGTVGQDNGSQFIPSGQAFFVEAKTNADVIFSNSDRAIGNNTTFYRVAENTNRIWLNLSNQENEAVSQQLLAFYEQATDSKDSQYDAHLLGSGMLFYSLLDNEKFSILANDNNYEGEVIPLGYQASHDGNYTISIDHTTGSIANNGNYIYLKDNETNSVHDLTASDYTFTTVLGENNTRFELFATETALAIDRVHNTDDQLIIMQDQGQFNLSTLENKTITTLTVYDALGRKLLHKNGNTFYIDCKKGQLLIIKVMLDNDLKLTKKVIKI